MEQPRSQVDSKRTTMAERIQTIEEATHVHVTRLENLVSRISGPRPNEDSEKPSQVGMMDMLVSIDRHSSQIYNLLDELESLV